MKDKGRWASSVLGLLAICSGTTGCVYDYPEPPQPAALSRGPGPTSPERAINRRILDQEADNFAGLDRLLGAPSEAVLFSDAGPLDGPARGFGKSAKVQVPGQYAITAACVGAAEAQLFLTQEDPDGGFRPVELELDCVGVTSRVIDLQQGYVSAHLLLSSPGDTPWTGAVAGVRVTRVS
ncbi:hypothetical protein QFZ65_001502 [Arthrobacter sp. B3I9]|nr:hypothetical protein [Arthrobacter sp. B3I9]